jgi:hypothetical protein
MRPAHRGRRGRLAAKPHGRASRDRGVALAHALLSSAACVRYAGGMVMRFTATVKNHEVVIRDVQLPDGEVVEVTVEPRPQDEWEPTPAELRSIAAGDADVAAGRVMSIDELLTSLKRSDDLRRQRRERSTARDRTRGGKVGALRTRTKSTAARGRSRK